MQTNNKLRKALTKILNLTNSLDEDCAVDPVEIRDLAKAALAEPVKNCEVGTAREQERRHKEEVCPKSACPKHEGFVSNACKGCFAMWAQKPYKEGGAK